MWPSDRSGASNAFESTFELVFVPSTAIRRRQSNVRVIELQNMIGSGSGSDGPIFPMKERREETEYQQCQFSTHLPSRSDLQINSPDDKWGICKTQYNNQQMLEPCWSCNYSDLRSRKEIRQYETNQLKKLKFCYRAINSSTLHLLAVVHIVKPISHLKRHLYPWMCVCGVTTYC